MASKPKRPKPTSEELVMRQRQTEQLARLDEEENRRLKSMTRMRLGGRSLLGSKGPNAAAAPSPSAGASPASPSRPVRPSGRGPMA